QTDLRILALNKNKITDLGPLVKWAKADAEKDKRFAPYLRLYLAGNPLSDDAKTKQLPELKKVGVRLEDLDKEKDKGKGKDKKGRGRRASGGRQPPELIVLVWTTHSLRGLTPPARPDRSPPRPRLRERRVIIDLTDVPRRQPADPLPHRPRRERLLRPLDVIG